ncbi:MAG: type II secretion system F family protein [Rhodospirillaceae bacterium]|nr:type II secretion system F family protein [Rhodospirillaceae bacterium]
MDGMIDGIWILFGSMILTLALLWLGLGGAESGGRRRLKARAEAAVRRGRGVDVPQAESIKRASGSISPLLDGLVRRFMPDPDAISRRLERTGRPISIGAYGAVHVAIALVALVFVRWGAGMSWIVAGMAAVGIGMAVPHMMVGYLGRRRIGKFEALFPDAIDLMVRGLRSGLPVSETIAAVGREMSDPVGAEFRRVADAVRLGRDQEDALWDTARRLDTPEFKFFVISLAIQKETGGNLSETLANLSEILRRRRQMRLKVRAMSSEARASAYILGSLPFLMFGVIFLLNPGYEEQLFTDPRGKIMLLAAGGLMTTGIAVMAKMVRFEI